MEKLVFLETPKGLMACGCGGATGLAQDQKEVCRALLRAGRLLFSYPTDASEQWCYTCLQYCRQVEPEILTLLIIKKDPPEKPNWGQLSAEGKQVSEAFSYARDIIRHQYETPTNSQHLRSFRRIICAEENTIPEEE